MKNIPSQKIEKTFLSAQKTYHQQAFAQHNLAQELLSGMNPAHFQAERVLEVGYGTGLFTQMYQPKINYKTLFLNDLLYCPLIFESDKPQANFIIGDAQMIELPENIDLFLSSSTLHWFADLPAFLQKIHRLLNKNGKACISLYTKGNLKEVSDYFHPLHYYTEKELCNLLFPLFQIDKQMKISHTLDFENSLDIFRHFKNTGINALKPKKSLFELRKKNIPHIKYQMACFCLTKKEN